jgi:hypothetical protein
MATLFSYRIPYDAGSAPNPFWGVCTLVICKPRVRRAATVGDWIVGTGSSRSPLGDISDRVVYIMRVSRKVTMQEYDVLARTELRQKVPQRRAADPRRRLGDAIYDFRNDPPSVRRSVHTERNRERDLSGRFALLSDHFYYFGDQPRRLPPSLRGLISLRQGHKSASNAALLAPFLRWVHRLGLEPNRLYGAPQKQPFGRIGIATCGPAEDCD